MIYVYYIHISVCIWHIDKKKILLFSPLYCSLCVHAALVEYVTVSVMCYGVMQHYMAVGIVGKKGTTLQKAFGRVKVLLAPFCSFAFYII